jgi:hypothetical protein
MNRWWALAASAVVAYAVVRNWDEIVRYRRMIAM